MPGDVALVVALILGAFAAFSLALLWADHATRAR